VANAVGISGRPLRVAIIGAGPSGFYAAGALLQHKDIEITVDMFDRLPAPYGLVRYGVAPDHQKIKSVIKIYDRTAADTRFRFFGNVTFGRDITHEDVRRHYDQVIYAVGAQSDRRLNIPGEDLRNSLSATEFVAWYNGHPDYCNLDIDLTCESVVVVGAGNVAMDVARILAKSVDELKETDIADHALERLRASKVKDIHVLSRRGPAQAKFTNPEIKEFGELEEADVVVHENELELDPLSAQELANDAAARRNVEILREFAARPLAGKPRRVHFRFLVSPVEIKDNGAGQVGAVRIERNVLQPDASGYLNAVGTGEYEELSAGMVLRSVGYKGVPLAGVPYNERSGVIPNRQGRVINPADNSVISGEYVVGWAKRGPSGVIGTNKPDAVETVEQMIEDIPQLPPAPEGSPDAIPALLAKRGVQYVTMSGWRLIDAEEVAAGEPHGRPRIKLTEIARMLEIARRDEAFPTESVLQT
jgi:ferredoxin--NADP+ reductase